MEHPVDPAAGITGITGAGESRSGPAQALFAALEPPLRPELVLEAVPELGLARGVGQGDFHHLDAFGHILQTIREVERELDEESLGARVPPERRAGLRLVGLLHDIAKPITRGEIEGRVLFVAHDTLGACYAHDICRRLGVSAGDTDLAVTLTALHLKIGFMSNPSSDYPPRRLARAAGPFAEELAVLSLADRLAARGARLKPEHVERHRELCADFLRESRRLGEREPAAQMPPDYRALAGRLGRGRPEDDADAGRAAGHLRLLAARGVDDEEALAQTAAMFPDRTPRTDATGPS
ncbi:HD domain-containing protein [Rubrobacter aplysinae]|uniref:HD domain-containing protein n=1 Tax=Rubrobacter aplysinae TaxID=909625 RepID=UPI00064B8761|nr:HD domain-containing protein [Rubrobacter aplysinae]